MDPSALIFVALAVAWAVYLIPKALEHHEESARSRTVDAFSHSVRVLARREPVSRSEATLVAGDDPAPPSHRELRREKRLLAKDAKREAKRQRRNARQLAAAARLPIDPRVRRQAAARAARRRLRVVTLILAEIAIVAVLAAVGVFGWVWMAIPVGILVAWLVACRLMVRRERAELPVVRSTAAAAAPGAEAAAEQTDATAGHPGRGGGRRRTLPTRTAGTRCPSRCRRTSRSRSPAAASGPSTSTPPASGPPAAARPTAPWSATRHPSSPSPASDEQRAPRLLTFDLRGGMAA